MKYLMTITLGKCAILRQDSQAFQSIDSNSYVLEFLMNSSTLWIAIIKIMLPLRKWRHYMLFFLFFLYFFSFVSVFLFSKFIIKPTTMDDSAWCRISDHVKLQVFQSCFCLGEITTWRSMTLYVSIVLQGMLLGICNF